MGSPLRERDLLSWCGWGFPFALLIILATIIVVPIFVGACPAHAPEKPISTSVDPPSTPRTPPHEHLEGGELHQ